jgi:hypothetical protein
MIGYFSSVTSDGSSETVFRQAELFENKVATHHEALPHGRGSLSRDRNFSITINLKSPITLFLTQRFVAAYHIYLSVRLPYPPPPCLKASYCCLQRSTRKPSPNSTRMISLGTMVCHYIFGSVRVVQYIHVHKPVDIGPLGFAVQYRIQVSCVLSLWGCWHW